MPLKSNDEKIDLGYLVDIVKGIEISDAAPLLETLINKFT
jgi:hypothetical protein